MQWPDAHVTLAHAARNCGMLHEAASHLQQAQVDDSVLISGLHVSR